MARHFFDNLCRTEFVYCWIIAKSLASSTNTCVGLKGSTISLCRAKPKINYWQLYIQVIYFLYLFYLWFLPPSAWCRCSLSFTVLVVCILSDWSLKNYIFCRVSPKYKTFFFFKHVPFNALVTCYLESKFHDLSLFCIFSIDFADF